MGGFGRLWAPLWAFWGAMNKSESNLGSKKCPDKANAVDLQPLKRGGLRPRHRQVGPGLHSGSGLGLSLDSHNVRHRHRRPETPLPCQRHGCGYMVEYSSEIPKSISLYRPHIGPINPIGPLSATMTPIGLMGPYGIWTRPH